MNPLTPQLFHSANKCACVRVCVRVCVKSGVVLLQAGIFSSAVPSGSGAFQMPTCPSSSSATSSASTLRGGRANLRNASVTFSLFWHEASLG